MSLYLGPGPLANTFSVHNFIGGGQLPTFVDVTITNSLTLTGATVFGQPTWNASQGITLSTAAQPNVTSLGTLTGLSISGSSTVSITQTGAGTNNITLSNSTDNVGRIAAASGNDLMMFTPTNQNFRVWSATKSGDAFRVADSSGLATALFGLTVSSGALNMTPGSISGQAFQISTSTVAASAGFGLGLNTAGAMVLQASGNNDLLASYRAKAGLDANSHTGVRAVQFYAANPLITNAPDSLYGLYVEALTAASTTENAALFLNTPSGAATNRVIDTQVGFIVDASGNVVVPSGATFKTTSGGSTTISTGVGSVRMSSANPATNTAWIPLTYAGTTYFVPAWTTNAP